VAGIAMGFVTDPRTRRKTLAIAAATAILFLAGMLFTEIWPIPAIVRAQLFRASRIALIVAFAHIAYGITQGLRQQSAIFKLVALANLIVLALPAFAVLLPWIVMLD